MILFAVVKGLAHVLFLFSLFPPAFFSFFPLQMVLPTLLKRLRKGAFLPTSGSSYPCLLPFLASLSVQTLLAPADGNKPTPFCAELVESLWTTIASATSLGGDANAALAPGGSGAAGKIADVASAHVECTTLLLLKLPPLPPPPPPQQQLSPEGAPPAGDGVKALPSGEGDGVKADSHLATSISVAAMNLARIVGSFVLDETVPGEGETDGRGGDRERRLRSLLEAAGKTRMVGDALGQALGQLLVGGERGSGVMGSAVGAETIWGPILQELMRALDER